MKVIKTLLRLLPLMQYHTNRALTILGFSMVGVLAVLSYAYMKGALADGEAIIDFSEAVSVWGGKVTYAWFALLLTWVTTNTFPYILRFRNWWVHSESHKVTREATKYIIWGEG